MGQNFFSQDFRSFWKSLKVYEIHFTRKNNKIENKLSVKGKVVSFYAIAQFRGPNVMIEKTVSVYSLTKSEVFISNAKLFHGWDDVSVRMFKICDESLVKPLFNVFQF